MMETAMVSKMQHKIAFANESRNGERGVLSFGFVTAHIFSQSSGSTTLLKKESIVLQSNLSN
jgi:hypothetical protein